MSVFQYPVAATLSFSILIEATRRVGKVTKVTTVLRRAESMDRDKQATGIYHFKSRKCHSADFSLGVFDITHAGSEDEESEYSNSREDCEDPTQTAAGRKPCKYASKGT